MAGTTENRYASIYINGNAADDTIKTLRDSSRKLKNELDKLPRSSEEFAEKSKLLAEVEDRLKSLRQEASGVSKALDNMSDELDKASTSSNKLSTLLSDRAKGLLGFAAISAAVVEGGRKVITQNAELSDSFAGVMKTTGLTLVEVEALDTALSKFNTRTAKSELLGLAQVAGKLGISGLKEVEGFVRAADRIGVALGEDLGGTEQAITSLGKLADIFKLKDEYGIEDALLKIGSAINSLGAAGTANEEYMVDFANRLAGIAPAANISIGNVLGLAATLDSLGQSGEKSSTAIGKFLIEMGSDVQKFAKIAKMDVEDFRKLMSTDVNEAFLRVLESSNATSGGIEALARSMNALEIKEAGAVAALGALANNIDTAREMQVLSSAEIEKGTSILDEFNTVNNTLAGNLEKIWNKLGQLWENGSARNSLTKLTAGVVEWIDKLSGAENTVKKSVEGFNLQKASAKDAEEQLIKLTKEYDVLKSKSNITKGEQDKLNETIIAIGNLVPEAITQWDKYGQALDINRSKIEGFTKAQRELLGLQNKELITELEKEFARFDKRSKSYQNMAVRVSKVLSSGKSVQGFDLNENQKTNLRQDYNSYKDNSLLDMGKAYEAAKAIRDAGGSLNKEMIAVIKYFESSPIANNIKKSDNNEPVSVTTGKDADKKKNKAAEEAKKEAERTKDQYEKLLKEDEAFKLARDTADSSWYEQQLANQAEHYNKQIDNWKEFLNRKGLTADQRNDATSKIERLENDKKAALAKKEIELEEETIRKISELRTKLNSKLQTERAKEEQSINDYYDTLFKKYEGNSEMQATIETNRSIDLANAKIREEERFQKESKALQDEAALSKLTDADRDTLQFKQKLDNELQALRDKYSAELQETELFKQAEQAILDRYANEAAAKEQEREKKKRDDIKNAILESTQSVADAVFTIQSNNRDRELQLSLNKLEMERNRELSVKNLTETQKKRINDKYDDLQRKEKQAAWKAQQAADIKQAAINTALAVTRALPNWINAAAAGAAGAAQIAVIASQKVPQFYHGGWTGEKPEGWVRKPTVFANTASGQPFSAGENWKAEYVISSAQLQDPLVADFASMLEAGRQKDIPSLLPQQPTIIQAPVDTSALEAKFDQLARAFQDTQNKRVVLVYQDLEDAADQKVSIQYQSNS